MLASKRTFKSSVILSSAEGGRGGGGGIGDSSECFHCKSCMFCGGPMGQRVLNLKLNLNLTCGVVTVANLMICIEVA